MARCIMPLLGLPLTALAADSPLLTVATEAPVTVCYFTNWARYRSGLINTGKDVFEMDIDGSLCTHYMYGFASVTQDFQLKASDPNADHPSGHAGQDGLCPNACNDPNFKTDWSNPNGERCDWPCSPTRVLRGFEGMTVGMKRKSPSSKALVSVGGWSFNDCAMSVEASYGQGTATCEIFSTIAASETTTRQFARNVITFCRKWGFDGFDLDWEYPVAAGHNSNAKPYVDKVEDYTNYISMLRIMKEEFNKENPTKPLLLTAAVGVGKATVDTAYNIPEMSKHLDLINLMSYDLHGGWESRVGCNANLFATDEDVRIGGGVGAGVAVAGYPLSVAWAVDYWLQHGASASKLTMGLGTYGRGWTLANPSNTAYNAPASGSCAPGISTKEAGYRAYYEIMDLLESGQATRYYDNDRQCPYVVTTTGEWIGYDDPQSLVAKVNFLKERGLRGGMVWALDLDDFAGRYGGGKYPLMNVIRKALDASGSGVVPAPVPATVPAPTTITTNPTTATPTAAPSPTTTRAATSPAPWPTTPAPVATTSQPLGTTTAAPAPTTKATTKAPTTSTTNPTTTAPAPVPAPTTTQATAAGCVLNADCIANAWCKDASYVSWCALQSASVCPKPQCIAGGAAAPAPAPTTPAPVASTTQPLATTKAPATSTTNPTTTAPAFVPAPTTTGATTTTQATAAGCVLNADCITNAWCKDASYVSWCALQSANACPKPQCIAGGVAAPVPAPTTPAPVASTTQPLATTKAPATSTTNPTTTAPASVPAPATAGATTTTRATAAGCVPNPDCSANAWCKDASYVNWCALQSASACPKPQCIAGGAAAPVPVPTTAAPVVPTTHPLATTTAFLAPTPTPTLAPTTTPQTATEAPLPAPTPTRLPAPTTAPPTATKAPNPAPMPSTGVNESVPGLEKVVQALSASNSDGVFMYDTGAGWVPSDLYTWPDMIQAVQVMAAKGVGSAKLWVGGGTNFKYGLVNIAAFLAQCMQETIQYNACDENNWSDKAVVAEAGGSTYSSTAACGQLHQSYQDYTCSAEEDALAGGSMACDVDPSMETRAATQAKWYGAPPALFCTPKSKVPKAPRWDYTSPWCPPAGGWGYEPAFPKDIPLDTYWAYVNKGGNCQDYDGIKTGGWKFDGEGCINGACPGSPAPLFSVPQGRTDVEGCCWWGRGVIQTTGTCNFGKLNYYMGARAAREGRNSIYPTIDFCRNPGAICEPGGPGELKWVAGFFYWLNAVQTYNSGGWNYINELQNWVDGGMQLTDNSFIIGASGIVNRGCHNPPNCGTGELHGGPNRINNFVKVLRAMKLV